MALTEDLINAYKKKLESGEYMKAGINGVADKLLHGYPWSKIPDVKLKTKEKEKKEMAKNSLMDLNDHLMETIEWLTDRDIKGKELDEQIKRSEAVSKVAAQVINNANLVLRAQIAVDHSEMGKMKLPSMLQDKPK